MCRLFKKGKIYILLIVIIECIDMNAFSQQSKPGLYLQTSEMADAMIQYDADKASILRFNRKSVV